MEVTSYGQMRNILKYGCYQVGNVVQSKQVHSVHDLISLKLNIRDKQLSKTSYNLDELRDLESKLVLITGSKAENRTEVDHYLDVCGFTHDFLLFCLKLICFCHSLVQVLQRVTRIAEVLLALRQAGNVTFSGRVVIIQCAIYASENFEQEPCFLEELAAQHVAELSTRTKEMENALQEWENEVKVSRNRYYELNYYTTLQLLRLRKELGIVRNNHCSLIDPEVLALLHCISHELKSENVCSVLNELEAQRLNPPNTAKLVHEDMSIGGTQVGEVHLSIPLTVEENSVSGDNSQEHSVEVSLENFENIKPQLTEQDLNDAQRDILADLVEYQGFSRLLVLKALEECHESCNTYDIQMWCVQNEGLNFEEDGLLGEETGTSSDGSSSESASSDEDENIFIPQSHSDFSRMTCIDAKFV